MDNDALVGALMGGGQPQMSPQAQQNDDLTWLLGRIKAGGAREAAADVAAQRGNWGSPMDWAMALGGGPRAMAPPMGFMGKPPGVRLGAKSFRPLTIQEEAAEHFLTPEAQRQANAQEMGFTTPAYRGVGQEPRRSPSDSWGSRLEYYSSENPELADRYAKYMRSGNEGHAPQVQPLLLKTDEYHTYDADGQYWDQVNRKAVRQARKLGKPGVIVNNVIDAPHTESAAQNAVGIPPQTVYITLDPSTARSKFAKFDPAKMGLNDLLASGAGVAVAAGAAHKILQNPDGTLQAAQE